MKTAYIILVIASLILLAGCAQAPKEQLELDYPEAEDIVEPPETVIGAEEPPEVPLPPESHEGPVKEIVELPAVEVREYKGEKLDSVKSFRDNSIRGVQEVDTSGYTLEVVGLVEQEMSYTYEDVLDHTSYTKVVRLYCVEGWDKNILWEGILLKDLFDEAGVLPEANTVIFHASDGYTTALPLDYLIDNNIMIAYKQNNVTLMPENGFPFQLVAEDKYGIKWIKWLNKIELSDDEDYLGYWESKGYNNEADVGGPVYG